MSQQINLYNAALRPKRDLLSAPFVALAGAACLVLVLVAGSVGASRLTARKVEAAQAADSLRQAQDRTALLTLKISSAKPDPALQTQVAQAQQQLDSRSAILATVAQGMTKPDSGYAEILRGLARQSLAGVWLTGVNVGANGSALELSGRALDRALVAEYLRRLNDEKIFAGRSFSGMRMALPKQDEPVSAAKAKAPVYLEFLLTATPVNAPEGSATGKGKSS